MARSRSGLTIVACFPCMVVPQSRSSDSYVNRSFIQKWYELVGGTSKIASEPRLPPLLVHKRQFVYQLLLRHTLWTLGGRGVWF
jgi:hypothetical protein